MYVFRSVTFYYVGRLVGITETDFEIDQAAWVGDTGDRRAFLHNGSDPVAAVPYPNGTLVQRGGLIEVCPYPHKPITETCR